MTSSSGHVILSRSHGCTTHCHLIYCALLEDNCSGSWVNGSHVVNVPLIQQRNVYKYSLDSESDSEESINTEVLSNDLEKNNACCAAFTVVFLIILYFFEFFLMCLYLIFSDRQKQGQMIAQGLCKNFPTWQFMENMTDSWCDPRIFDRDFRLDLQYPCFVPEMFRNMTVY